MLEWNTLLCTKRERGGTFRSPEDTRSEFRRDYHRIIGSASFRRLQDKAQVYPLYRGDFVRTRLTHSLEVSSFAGSLGDTVFRKLINEGKKGVDDTVRENCCDILECAGLVHDIGNPPFGHFGEYAIRSWFKDNFGKLQFRGQSVTKLLTPQIQGDFLNFEGNAQALRLLTRLHSLIDMKTGMNLTYALLNTIIKYPSSSLEIDKSGGNILTKKMGYFTSEQELFRDIVNSTGAVNCRYPLTFLLESADDIAYKTADIEDAAVKELISYGELLEELEKLHCEKAAESLKHSKESAEKSGMSNSGIKAVQRWIVKIQSEFIYAAAEAFCENYESIMAGEFRGELLKVSSESALSDALSDIARRYAFQSKEILKDELSEHKIIYTLLEKITGTALRIDTDEQTGYDLDLAAVLSENYLEICRRSTDGKPLFLQAYHRLQFATDCICGMTDGYAEEFYKLL